MRAVLDASFFFYEIEIDGEIYTTPSVCDELRDIRSRGRFEKFCATGLRVLSPGREFREKVAEAAKTTGDVGVISETDRDLLSLALELGGVLHTDDFAIQNIAGRLGVTTIPLHQRRARQILWKYRCLGCGKYFDHDGECRICGAEIKRKLK